MESKDKVKYLGVIFEEDMSWNKQVNEIMKLILVCIKLEKFHLSLMMTAKKLLLNALVLHRKNYCYSSWNTMSAANTKKFESLIRSIDKIHPMNKTFQKMKTYKQSAYGI